eukprot:CAMPEP_0114269986 /NCGR_PEP_ID=MMETSP0058-20121206/26966_1 /TAXON_ID=36894 /ORGANISM="Pyramimonas parkeae, CCMP726" /LENGTH=81 /DNA_ID=CAMNT_0001388631 /DNA_START=95 /DNA_END=340 /DNA_ORIENTATION=-
MAVAESARRTGVATALINGALEYARAIVPEPAILALFVFPNNESAIRMYEKLGFRDVHFTQLTDPPQKLMIRGIGWRYNSE